MEELPGWTQEWFSASKHEEQVSHGLNLALKLAKPIELPLLLAEIAGAQPLISAALESLSFVHFARFVPSWDATALMVITEFDGPLEPYVMDFVIALGDVFDVILKYVDPKAYNPAWLPVKHHPDQFWEFVQHWNRVPLAPRWLGDGALYPRGEHYPLYSAYPQKTVIDIAGARQGLPPPVWDRPAAQVDLSDVQGNILRGYRATVGVHLFMKVVDPKCARKWLADGFAGSGSPWLGVRNASTWSSKPDVMANVGFTYPGLQILLSNRAKELEKFPVAFREGAHLRAALNGDLGDSRPERWIFGRDDQEIHVVLSLYAYKPTLISSLDHASNEDPSAESGLLESLLNQAQSNGLARVHLQIGATNADGMDHFGFADGISKPRISGQCEPSDRDMQPAASPGEFLLGKGYADIYGGPSIGTMPADIAQNGTFGAMRLMEQHRDVLDRTIASESARLCLAPDLLKAKLLGRWAHGEPLAVNPDGPPNAVARNDFDYAPSWEYPDVPNDHEGDRCPVGAHIRRTNPRTARVAGQRHSRRLIRRGMPSFWPAEAPTHFGLLGLFICGSLERQFEFIQREWIQGSLAASGIRGTQDPIAGIRDGETDLPLGKGTSAKVPPLVTTRGTLYLFFPSLSAIRGLKELAKKSFDPSAASSEAGQATVAAESASGWMAIEPDDQNTLLALQAMVNGLSGGPPSAFANAFVASLATFPSLKPALPSCDPNSPLRPLDPRFVANPFPAYATLRAQGKKVVWVCEHEAYWVLDRKEAEAVLSDHSSFVQQLDGSGVKGLLTMDPPRHTQVRKIIANAFSQVLARIDPVLSKELGTAISGIGSLQHFDFMHTLGMAVPRRVYWTLFGPGSEEKCNTLAETAMRHFGQPVRPGINDAQTFRLASLRLGLEVGKLLLDAWLKRKSSTSPYANTLLGETAAQISLVGGLRPDEALATLVQLSLVHMSSQFLLGTAARNLLLSATPGGSAWRQLASLGTGEPFNVALDKALVEARRIDPPVTIIERYAKGKQTIAGVDIADKSRVFVNVGSANRDLPAGSKDPESFDWTRDNPSGNLSLGHGIHECVGSMMQQVIVKGILTDLIPRFTDLRLSDQVAVPAWIDNVYFRSLLALPVTRCAP